MHGVRSSRRLKGHREITSSPAYSGLELTAVSLIRDERDEMEAGYAQTSLSLSPVRVGSRVRRATRARS